jgi:hypothetical protein
MVHANYAKPFAENREERESLIYDRYNFAIFALVWRPLRENKKIISFQNGSIMDARSFGSKLHPGNVHCSR